MNMVAILSIAWSFHLILVVWIIVFLLCLTLGMILKSFWSPYFGMSNQTKPKSRYDMPTMLSWFDQIGSTDKNSGHRFFWMFVGCLWIVNTNNLLVYLLLLAPKSSFTLCRYTHIKWVFVVSYYMFIKSRSSKSFALISFLLYLNLYLWC